MNISGNKKVLLIGAAAVAVLVGGVFWFITLRPTAYTITSFEPITLYNHVGQNGYINNAVPAAIVSVLKYYGEEFTDEELKKINQDFFISSDSDSGKPQSVYDYQKYLGDMGYETKLVPVSSMGTLKKYLYAERLPVLSWIPFPDQPADLDTNMAMVLTGFDEKKGTLTFHEYYGGHGQTMPFEEYVSKNKIFSLVIVPKNDAYKNRAPREEFLQRTEAMNRATPLILKLTFAHLYLNQKNYAWIPIAQEVVADPRLEDVPPYYRVLAYAYASNSSVLYAYKARDMKDSAAAQKFIAEAKDTIAKAEAINHDLDKPFGNFWAGFVDYQNPVIGISDTPFFVRGLIYEYEREYQKAIESLNKALEIWPYGQNTIDLLARVRNKM